MNKEYDELEDPGLNHEEDDIDDEDAKEDDDEEDDDDEGISFEKYAELSAKIDHLEADEEAQKKMIKQEGYTWEDWDFYKNVWAVEILSDTSKTLKFAEIYAKFRN